MVRAAGHQTYWHCRWFRNLTARFSDISVIIAHLAGVMQILLNTLHSRRKFRQTPYCKVSLEFVRTLEYLWVVKPPKTLNFNSLNHMQRFSSHDKGYRLLFMKIPYCIIIPIFAPELWNIVVLLLSSQRFALRYFLSKCAQLPIPLKSPNYGSSANQTARTPCFPPFGPGFRKGHLQDKVPQALQSIDHIVLIPKTIAIIHQNYKASLFVQKISLNYERLVVKKQGPKAGS